MLLTDIIRKIAEKNDVPYKIAEEIIDNIFKDMIACLGNGGRIEIRDFGVFSLRYRRSRITRNPKTGENLVTLSKYHIHFKPGKLLRARVNNSTEDIL